MAPWRDSAWWKTERQFVKDFYPGAHFYRRINEQGEAVGVWMLTMEPAPTESEASFIYEDLELGNVVSVGIGGQILHSENCETDHSQNRRNWSLIRLSGQPLRVELEYPANLDGNVGPVHPRFRVLSHGIVTPHHPHLYQMSGHQNYWACPITPHGTDWSWENGGTLGYLDQCATWLLKTEIWIATGGENFPSLRRWLGPYSSHQASEVLNEASLDGPCRCGRGTAYKDCCFARDKNSSRQ